MNFTAANGKARWRILFDLVKETPVGEVLTYAQAQRECGGCPRNAVQAAMIKANIELGRAGENQVDTKPDIGWVVLKPNDAVPLVVRQRTKTERAADRTAGRINALQLRRGELSAERRAELDREQAKALRIAEINGKRRRETRTLAERVAELEQDTPRKLRG